MSAPTAAYLAGEFAVDDLLESLAAAARPLGLVVDLAPYGSKTRPELVLQLEELIRRRDEEVADRDNMVKALRSRLDAAQRQADTAANRVRVLERDVAAKADSIDKLVELESSLRTELETQRAITHVTADVDVDGAGAASPPHGPAPAPDATDDSPPAPADLPGLGRGALLRRAAILDNERLRRGEWLAPRELKAEADLILRTNPRAWNEAIAAMRAHRELEHNGGERAACRYRLAGVDALDRQDQARDDRRELNIEVPATTYPGLPEDPGGPIVIDRGEAVLSPEEAAEAVRAQDVAPTRPSAANGRAAATVTVPRETPTERIQREQREAAAERVRRREEKEARRKADAERARIATPLDHRTDGATVLGSVLESSHYQPGTIPELAARLALEERDVATAILELEAEGDIDRAGRRNGNIIYRGRA